MTEQEAIEVIKNNFPKTCKMVNGRYQGGFDDTEGDFGKALLLSISALEEIQKYRALGTVEELHKAKTQYENIASCAEKISLSGLCNYEETQQNIVSSLKVTSKNTLEEYIKIGTVEELREVREKQKAKKPLANKYYYFCPNCGTRRSIKQKHRFCHDCGQAIDWSEEND